MTAPKIYNVASLRSGNDYEEKRLSEFPTLNSLLADLHLSPTGHTATVQKTDTSVVDNIPGNYKFSEGEYVIINSNDHKSG
tara:strand:- start:302 stop:544 length:243 start_codon:yes stop_codon:yes gene_type:complete